MTFENQYEKNAFEYEQVWNVWDSTFWNPAQVS